MGKPRAYYDLLKLSSLGLEMGGAVVIGLLMGVWLDRRFGTEPWLTFVFLGFGFVAAGKAVYRAIRKGIVEEDYEEEVGQEVGQEAGLEAGKEAGQDDGHGQ
jgi:ATP synthase protein I